MVPGIRSSPPAPGPARVLLWLATLGGLVAGCLNVITEPGPTSRGSIDPSLLAQLSPGPPATGQPRPTTQTYVVRRGDTLHAIARRFGLTVGQLLAANPSITDPNRIQVGQVLVIPPPDAPDTGPNSADMGDVRDDVADLDGEPIPGQSYVDITSVGARLDTQRRILVQVVLVHMPPPRMDPGVEVVTYTIEIDTEGDGQPDFRVVYSNAEGTGRFTAALEDRTSGRIRAGDAFPGTVEVGERVMRFRMNRAAFGDPRRYLLAFKAERLFHPDGIDAPGAEASADYAPDQQWPRPNPRWVEIGGV
jgi:LysM repeat protein